MLESRIMTELLGFTEAQWQQLSEDNWVLSVVPTTSTYILTYTYGSHQQVSQQVTITYTVTTSES